MTVTLRSGDRVVVDANTLVDYLLWRASVLPTSPSERMEVRARATDRLVELCCVLCLSTKLRKELEGTIRKRVHALPRLVMLALITVKDRGKLRETLTSRIDSRPLPPEIVKRLPGEDVHVYQLAVCEGARTILTDDGPFLESGRGLTDAVDVVSPDEVLEPAER
jgi:hypothetical protein